jgi:hypothetical protein
VAALFATLLTRVFAFAEGRTADLARANFVLAFAAIFLIFDLTGARFEYVLDLPRLVAFFISSSSAFVNLKQYIRFPSSSLAPFARTRWPPGSHRSLPISFPGERNLRSSYSNGIVGIY